MANIHAHLRLNMAAGVILLASLKSGQEVGTPALHYAQNWPTRVILGKLVSIPSPHLLFQCQALNSDLEQQLVRKIFSETTAVTEVHTPWPASPHPTPSIMVAAENTLHQSGWQHPTPHRVSTPDPF